MSLLESWVEIPQHSDFSIDNLPYGIFSTQTDFTPRLGVAIGNQILNLPFCYSQGFFDDLAIEKQVFFSNNLNDLMALGREKNKALRKIIQEILGKNFSKKELINASGLVNQAVATMHLPIKIGDYTDFYSSIEHASNAGKIFRDPSNALFANWRHLPVAYHGRASSIYVSGQNFHRPKGQILATDGKTPIFSATKALDFELEIATVIGKASTIGEPITTQQAEEYVFGFLLFNDWSARDIQRWEYQPLGPFLGKNFFSSVSPWVVTIEALEPFRVASPLQNPAVLAYLQTDGLRNFDLNLSVSIQPNHGETQTICRTNFSNMYWNIAQQIAHHTINGCNLNVGDLLASGTISGSEPDSFGSLLEKTYNGKQSFTLKDGTERCFLEDNDTVIMNGWGEKNGIRVGFGEVRNQVLSTR
jgi:fumarylacetoacetase